MARFQIIDSGLSNILFASDDFNEVYEQALDYLDNNRSCKIKIFDQDTKISIPVTYDDVENKNHLHDKCDYGKEYTSLKNEKEEFAIIELEYLKANIRFQGYYDERIEDLIDTQISVLKGDTKHEDDN